MQAAAEGALRKGLESLDRRLGFRGPIGTVAPAQRGAWTGGPAHPLTGATDDTTALADQLLPEQRYGAMVVELPRNGVGVDRRPRAQAAAARRRPTRSDVRAWRRQADRRAGRSSATCCRCGCRADGNAVDARAAPGAAGRDGRDGSAHRPRARAGRRLRLDRVAVRSRDPGARARSARRSSRSSTRPRSRPASTPVDHMHDGPFSVHDRDRHVDARELRQQVPRRRHADDRARVLAQHDQRAARGAGRPRSHHRDHARLRHHVADPAPHLDQPRHARPHAARGRGRATPASRTAAAASRRGSSISSPTRAATSSTICATRRPARRSSRPRSTT